jgi:hypothetical protein
MLNLMMCLFMSKAVEMMTHNVPAPLPKQHSTHLLMVRKHSTPLLLVKQH